MTSSQPDTTELQDKLKSSLWFSLGRLCTSECTRLNISATPQFIGSLTEMVWAQIETVAIDLETFSRHAGRTTITTDDVLWFVDVTRRCRESFKDFVDRGKADTAAKSVTGGGNGKGKRKAKD